MTIYSDFDDHLAIDGVSLNSYLRQVEIVPIMETFDNTAGSETTRSRIATIEDYLLNFVILYDTDDEDVILSLIVPGRHLVDYGIRGNSAGMPRHQQWFIFTESPSVGDFEMTEGRMFSVSAECAEAPIHNMFKGGVYA